MKMRTKSLAINATLNSINTALAMIFPLITFPYASRVLHVENLGKVSFSHSIVNYFVLLAGLGISTYAIREGARIRENRERISAFASEVFTINIISTVFAYLCLFITSVCVSKLHAYYTLIIIQSVVMIGNAIGVGWLYSIYEDYLLITIRSIVVQIVSMILLFIMVHKEEDYLIYAGITTFSATVANVFNFIYSRKYINLRLVRHPNFSLHMKPILIVFATSVASIIYVNADVTMLGMMTGELGDYYVGIYNASTKIYSILKQLMAASVLVALPRMSNEIANHENEKYRMESSKVLNTSIMLLFPCATGLFMISHEVIMIVAGELFAEATDSMRILCISLLFSTLANYYTCTVLLPHKKEKQVLIASAISAILNVCLNVFMIPLYKHIGAALTTVVAELVVFVLLMMSSRKIPHGKYAWKDLAICVIGCGFIVCVCKIVSMINISDLLKLPAKVVFSGMIYMTVLIIGRHSFALQIVDRLKKKRILNRK